MKIARVEPSKHINGRVLVFLEDGQLLKVTENELLQFSLRPGQELTEETLRQLQKTAEKSQWKQTAAAMAGQRMLSRKEIRDRLIKKGAEETEAEETAQWLCDLGAVDDASYAAVLVRHYAASGYGAGRIRQEFQKRGIPREMWEGALAQLPPPEEAIRAYVRTKMRTGDEKERKKIADALLRRGFGWNEIRPVLREWGAEMEEEA